MNVARYDREFLVPYLQDVCALYMAEKRIEEQIHDRTLRQRNYERQIVVKKPLEPDYEVESLNGLGIGGVFLVMIGSFLCMVGGAGEKLGGGGTKIILGYGIFALILGGLMLIYDIKKTRKARKRNKALSDFYENELAEYKHQLMIAENENKWNRSQIPDVNRQIARLKEERTKVISVRESVYGANVIPKHYRNIYAAVFLYDWFSTSGADDLDMALNMFVLEEIKDKLDAIIRNQSAIILNQRLILAKQQESMERQASNHRRLMQKLDSIHAEGEEHTRYLSMIESNTKATAYFAAAEYLK